MPAKLDNFTLPLLGMTKYERHAVTQSPINADAIKSLTGLETMYVRTGVVVPIINTAKPISRL
jgi:hypothetical protein